MQRFEWKNDVMGSGNVKKTKSKYKKSEVKQLILQKNYLSVTEKASLNMQDENKDFQIENRQKGKKKDIFL